MGEGNNALPVSDPISESSLPADTRFLMKPYTTGSTTRITSTLFLEVATPRNRTPVISAMVLRPITGMKYTTSEEIATPVLGTSITFVLISYVP